MDLIFSKNFNIKDNILILPSFVAKEFANKIIDFAEDKNKWNKAKTVGEQTTKEAAVKSARQAENMALGHYKELNEQIKYIFEEALNIYNTECQKIDTSRHEGYNLLKYQPGGYYKAHKDSSATNQRKLSALIYLNDDYTGGELEFFNPNHKITPTAGSVVIFPSNYLHAALSIKTGTKYAIVTWFS